MDNLCDQHSMPDTAKRSFTLCLYANYAIWFPTEYTISRDHTWNAIIAITNMSTYTPKIYEQPKIPHIPAVQTSCDYKALAITVEDYKITSLAESNQCLTSGEREVCDLLSSTKFTIKRIGQNISIYLDNGKFATISQKPYKIHYHGSEGNGHLLPILIKLIFDYTSHSLTLPANLSRLFTDSGYRFIGKDTYKYTYCNGDLQA